MPHPLSTNVPCRGAEDDTSVSAWNRPGKAILHPAPRRRSKKAAHRSELKPNADGSSIAYNNTDVETRLCGSVRSAHVSVSSSPRPDSLALNLSLLLPHRSKVACNYEIASNFQAAGALSESHQQSSRFLSTDPLSFPLRSSSLARVCLLSKLHSTSFLGWTAFFQLMTGINSALLTAATKWNWLDSSNFMLQGAILNPEK